MKQSNTTNRLSFSIPRKQLDSWFYNLAICLYDRGDFDGAQDNYRKAIDVDPNNDLAHYGLATLQIQMD